MALAEGMRARLVRSVDNHRSFVDATLGGGGSARPLMGTAPPHWTLARTPKRRLYDEQAAENAQRRPSARHQQPCAAVQLCCARGERSSIVCACARVSWRVTLWRAPCKPTLVVRLTGGKA